MYFNRKMESKFLKFLVQFSRNSSLKIHQRFFKLTREIRRAVHSKKKKKKKGKKKFLTISSSQFE